MNRADRVAGVLLLALSVWFAAVALARYKYWTPTGPGSGFLPVWLAAAMAVLALLLIAKSGRAPGAAASPWPPGGRSLARPVAVVGATALLVALMPVVGMIVGTVLLLLVLLRWLEGYRWRVAASVAFLAAAVNYLVFTYWLGVPFPVGVLGF